MADETIRVVGLRETLRALNKCEKGLRKEVLLAGKVAAEPVAAAAREKLGRYAGASVSTVRPRSGARGAFVTQGARKVTGLRGDFGALQMTHVLMPALEEQREVVITIYERGLDRLITSAGF